MSFCTIESSSSYKLLNQKGGKPPGTNFFGKIVKSQFFKGCSIYIFPLPPAVVEFQRLQIIRI